MAALRPSATLFHAAALIQDLILTIRWVEEFLQDRFGAILPHSITDKIDDIAIIASDSRNLIINVALQNVEFEDIGPPPFD